MLDSVSLRVSGSFLDYMGTESYRTEARERAL